MGGDNSHCYTSRNRNSCGPLHISMPSPIVEMPPSPAPNTLMYVEFPDDEVDDVKIIDVHSIVEVRTDFIISFFIYFFFVCFFFLSFYFAISNLSFLVVLFFFSLFISRSLTVLFSIIFISMTHYRFLLVLDCFCLLLFMFFLLLHLISNFSFDSLALFLR